MRFSIGGQLKRIDRARTSLSGEDSTKGVVRVWTKLLSDVIRHLKWTRSDVVRNRTFASERELERHRRTTLSTSTTRESNHDNTHWTFL